MATQAKKAAEPAPAEETAPVTQNEEATGESTEAEETPTSIAEPSLVVYPATVEDPVAGVERIVQPAGDGWEPAPIDPDPAVVEAAERAQERFEEAKARRLEQATTGVSVADRDDLSDEQKQAAKGPGQLAGDSKKEEEKS